MKNIAQRFTIFPPKVHESHDRDESPKSSSPKTASMRKHSMFDASGHSAKRSRLFSQHAGGKKQSMFVNFATPDKGVRGRGGGHRDRRRSSVAENVHAMYNRISDIVETEITKKEKEEERDRWKAITTEIKLFLGTSLFGAIYDWSLLFASIVSIILYIAQLYDPHPDKTGVDLLLEGDPLFVLELCLCMLFSADIVLWLFLAEQKFDYLFR